MNKDARRDPHSHVIFQTKEEETLARVHNQWIKLHFSQVQMQLPTSYPVKVNWAWATAILDPESGRVVENAKEIVSDSNNGLKITSIGWLSRLGTGKLYGSMVVCLAGKKDADLLISRGLIEIGGETAYMEVFQQQSQGKKRCFNCQQYGYKASECNNTPVCGNCSSLGHSHLNCREPQVRCSNFGGSHPASSSRCPSNPSTRYLLLFPRADNATREYNASSQTNSNDLSWFQNPSSQSTEIQRCQPKLIQWRCPSVIFCYLDYRTVGHYNL